MDAHRGERLAEALRNELSELVNFEMDDPRLQSVEVTEVLVSPDRKKAHIRVAIRGNRDQQLETLEVIEKARGYLRHRVGERLEMYRTPDFHFSSDIEPEVRQKADKLLKKIRKGRPRDLDPAGTARKNRPD
ncbi:MAG: 30S ribosome-binding factor RbfA [Acidimicrobiia bacterium]|nr:30S ribosome-binding factor RbfA [Acidimicrobiia bacterium]